MIEHTYKRMRLISKNRRRSFSYFGFPIQTLYLGFLKTLPQSKRVLDIGCGNGFLLRHLNFWENNSFAIDASLDLIEDLKSESFQQVFHHELSQKSLPMDDNFDWVFCLDVLEHVPDRKEFIGALLKLKNANNHLMLSFPNQRHHGTDGLIDIKEFEDLKKLYQMELVQIIQPYWFVFAQTLKALVKSILSLKEGDLFHENPAFQKIRPSQWSTVLSRIFEFYFFLYTLFPAKTKVVQNLEEEGIYMIYFGKSLEI
ncbi:class I SAM-dependent methyltransferase [bacterium]|nr:class I SAM-dependent methyltransferase [bacterium]